MHILSLGKFPQVSLANARKYRNEALTLIQKGLQPCLSENQVVVLKEVENEGAREVFKTIALEWHQGWSRGVSVKHAKRALVLLEQNAFPHIGKVTIRELTAVKVLKTLNKQELAGVRYQTNVVIGQVLKYAVATGRVEYDCRSALSSVVRRPEEQHFASIAVSDIPLLLYRIHAPEAPISPAMRIVLLMLLHTMTRTQELLGITWKEVSLGTALWTIPATRMKVRREHHIPLSGQALELLTKAKELSGDSEFVFPSPLKPGQHIHPREANRALTSLGYKGQLTAHGIRSLCAGLLVARGHSIDVVDAALSHQFSKVRRAYFRHPDLTARRAMFQDLGDYMQTQGMRVELVTAPSKITSNGLEQLHSL